MARLRRVAASLAELPRETVEEGAATFDRLAVASASRVVGGGSIMRTHEIGGRRPVRLATTASVEGGSTSATARIEGTPRAQWRWIEDGTRPHRVPPTRRYLAGALGHPVQGAVPHPGSRGQHAWSRAVDSFQGEARDLGRQKLREAVRG